MKINWYPGHMAKTRRLMIDDLKNVDIVCEIVDARIPVSSRNPDLFEITKNKKRLIVLNRADQADKNMTAKWEKHFKEQGYFVIITDAQHGVGVNAFKGELKKIMAEEIQRNIDKGMAGKAIRVMVIGVPNVGKSSFINRVLGKKSAAAADKPGVTRSKQWFSLGDGIDLMDTPGMLPSKIEDETSGVMLAFTGTIRDEILDIEELACEFIKTITELDFDIFVKRYNITKEEDEIPYDTLTRMAKARGFLLSRGEYDTERMAKVLLDEFRSGKLGNITLEVPR
ncbi:MAG: ribosome biogenesis GTPase YlqF [Clostridia bacterium]|nr:ribosome biogenesis GTPase YlqF [Clostridia bacterium]